MTPMDRYKRDLHPHVFSKEKSEAVFAALLTWYQTAGRNQFVGTFEKETGIDLSGVNRSDQALVEHGYPKNINEYETKVAWDNYYVANALIGLKEMDRLLNAYFPLRKEGAAIFYRNGLALAPAASFGYDDPD